jgi:hypothetical protein
MSAFGVACVSASLVLQSEREEFRVRRLVVRVKNTSYPEAFRDLNEHRGVFYIQNLMCWRLSDIKRKPENVRVGLAEMDEAGGNEGIHKPIQFESANPICIQFERFVADNGDFQTVPRLQSNYHPDHVFVWFRLLAHEAPKLLPSERSLFVKNDET